MGFQRILNRLSSVRRQLDWQTHKDTHTHEQLSDFFNLLRPISLDRNDLARFGSDSDGGYVIESKTLKGAHVISLGVGDNISFDLAVAKVAKTITLYDHTIQKLPSEIPNAIFVPKKVVANVMDRNHEVSLEELLDVYTYEDKVLLKIDIEGYEWEILSSIDWRKYPQVIQIVIEFHGILQKSKNFQTFEMVALLKKLRANFEVINFHPNNYGDFEVFLNIPVPDVVEVTLIRKDKLRFSPTNTNGNVINSPNNPDEPEIYFPLNDFS
jgi:hypothetical protein